MVDEAEPIALSPTIQEQQAAPSSSDDHPHAAATAEQLGIEVVATSPPPEPSPPLGAAPEPAAELPSIAENGATGLPPLPHRADGSIESQTLHILLGFILCSL